MRVLLAPDKFKGTFTARQVCRHVAAGIHEADPGIEVIRRPLADGGEGTLDVILDSLGGVRLPMRSVGPLGSAVRAPIGRLEDGSIVVESARFCGLHLISSARRNPMRATTYGLGRVLARVFTWKPPSVLLGLGGTATLDGGAGMARALGYRFLGTKGEELDGSPEQLLRLRTIEGPARSQRAPRIRCVALCDVANELAGPRGSAAVFGPQKGASPAESDLAGRALERLGRIVEHDLGIAVARLPGAGAAGGLGAGCRAFLGGRLTNGTRQVMRLVGFDRSLEGVDLVVTGEGSYDEGSRKGKVVSEMIALAVRRKIPVVLLCGRATLRPGDPGVRIMPLGVHVGNGDLQNAGKCLVQQRFS